MAVDAAVNCTLAGPHVCVCLPACLPACLLPPSLLLPFCRRLPAEETNTRVAWFSIFSLAVCVTSAVFQLMYLRKFFQRKKLL